MIRARDEVARFTHGKTINFRAGYVTGYSHMNGNSRATVLHPLPRLEGSRFLFCSGGMGGWPGNLYQPGGTASSWLG